MHNINKIPLIFSLISSMVLAMDIKHGVELNSKSGTALSSAQLAALYPNLRATAGLGVLPVPDPTPTPQKGHNENELVTKSLALTKPIAAWKVDDKKKKAEFEGLLSERHHLLVSYNAPNSSLPKQTKRLYEMACDPFIKKILKDEKTKKEIDFYSLSDIDGKTVLEHAIENNDAPFVSNAFKNMNGNELQLEKKRLNAFAYAAGQKKPRVLLALIPNIPGITTQKALQDTFMQCTQNPLMRCTITQYNAYHAALSLALEHAKIRSRCYLKAFLSKEQVNYDAATLIASMFEPTVTARETGERFLHIHPQLETSIESGDREAFNKLLIAGYALPSSHHNELKEIALSLIKHERIDMLKDFIKQSPYTLWQEIQKAIDDEIKSKNEKLQERKEFYTDQDFKEKIEKIQALQKVITHDLAEHQTIQNNTLIEAWQENNLGLFMQALNTGSDPNANNELGQLLALDALCSENSVFLKMMLDKGLDPNSTAPDEITGKMHPLLAWAIDKNKPEQAQILIDAGANINANNGLGVPIAWIALSSDDSIFLKMMLDRGLDPDTTVADDKGKMHPLLDWAKELSKPQHVALLKKAKG